MAAGGENGGSPPPPTIAADATDSLLETPTWAVATVCFFFIAVSILIDHLIHLVGQWLKRHRKTALFEAVEKLKSVLMQLGFMSLVLVVAQRFLPKICVPTSVALKMLPCRKMAVLKTTNNLGHTRSDPNSQDFLPTERILAATSTFSDSCGDDKLSFMSQEGLNQLNVFIFVLAAMQIVYSILTMALGRAKMKRWKGWEEETQTVEYQAANGTVRTDFVGPELSFQPSVHLTDIKEFESKSLQINSTDNICKASHKLNQFISTLFCEFLPFSYSHVHLNVYIYIYIYLYSLIKLMNVTLESEQRCFLRQFFHSVAKVDYLTLRHGFIAAHCPSNQSFNFQKYIERSLEDDFKVVVGISPLMWFLVVIFILVDVHGWNAYLWVSFLPLIIVLALGTKLEVIVAKMALQLNNQHAVIKGAPLVKPNDDLFWFHHPKFVLSLLHVTLFMNAFEMSFFIWVTWQFGIHSCYHEQVEIIVTRVVLAITVQVLCSYITLPLYALVTQMGSQFKSAVLEEQTVHALKKWHTEVRDKRKQHSSHSPSSSHWSDSRSNTFCSTTDGSSHRKAPTFGEITYLPDKNSDHIVEEEPDPIDLESTVAFPNPVVLQLELPVLARIPTLRETNNAPP
ncbi:Mlo-related protein [Dillenia turbinata]|uniref:MLO-like protein n=1 Tax=Dillenia turbinata TaxID=194707 RepID=A0AAN8VB30_9MAGN